MNGFELARTSSLHRRCRGEKGQESRESNRRGTCIFERVGRNVVVAHEIDLRANDVTIALQRCQLREEILWRYPATLL